MHYEGGAVIAPGDLIDRVGLQAITSDRVWVIDMDGGGWGSRRVDVPSNWRLVQRKAVREAYGVQGTMLIQEYRQEPLVKPSYTIQNTRRQSR